MQELINKRFVVITTPAPKKRWGSLRHCVCLYDGVQDKVIAKGYPKLSNLIKNKHTELLKINKRFQKVLATI